MPGKITQPASWATAVDPGILSAPAEDDAIRTFTPMWSVPVVHVVDQTDRIVAPMVWGFTDRKAKGRRIPRNMHARGETVDRLPAFSDAFRYRRGVTLVRSFNDGKEIDVPYDDGTPSGKVWTQQWTIRPTDGRPVIIGVVYDLFDAGRGPEYEFVQITTQANARIAAISDRMPLILHPDDLDVWLGEQRAPLEDVVDLIRVFEFGDDWDLSITDPDKKPPRPRKPKGDTSPQGSLF